MQNILKFQRWNASDYCSAAECAVEAGKMLSVQYVIYGSVAHIGKLYSLNTSLVDIETGRVTSSAVTDFEGTVENFVRGVAEDNIRSLLLVKQTPKEWTSLS